MTSDVQFLATAKKTLPFKHRKEANTKVVG